MANSLDVVLRPTVGPFLEWIHSYENVRPSRVLVPQPGLELWTRYGFCRCDPLHRLGRPAIPRQNRHGVCWVEQSKGILRS
jgi:hypothetical protein